MNQPGLSLLVAEYQINLMPGFGYFEKALKCDLFVDSDDVQFFKQHYANHAAIPIGWGSRFLTLHIRKVEDARIVDCKCHSSCE